jgi:hypothetical protein
MKMDALAENARTLAAILGMDEEEAEEKLSATALLTFNRSDHVAALLADMISQQLNRTLRRASTLANIKTNPTVEVVIGNSRPRSSGPQVFVTVSADGMNVSFKDQDTRMVFPVHRSLLLLTSCYAAAAALKAVVKEARSGAWEPITMSFSEVLGENPSILSEKAELGEAYLVGAGAVGNAFLYALRHFNVSGQLHVVDPKRVSPGNLNRCMFFDAPAIGFPKATYLCDVARPFFKKLDLVPEDERLDQVEAKSNGPWLRRLIVAVDSRRARRSLQAEIPGEVYDASTTDIREIVLHFNRQPTDGECLCCVYKEERNERAREAHIARVLGVTVEAVQKGFITSDNAERIHRVYTSLDPSSLVGTAYDTLFKTLCGQGALRTDEGRQVLAPFAFVSLLAGTYLAIELVMRLQQPSRGRLFNYWRASPWSSPVLRLRRYRLARGDCEFCSSESTRKVIKSLWGR